MDTLSSVVLVLTNTRVIAPPKSEVFDDADGRGDGCWLVIGTGSGNGKSIEYNPCDGHGAGYFTLSHGNGLGYACPS